MSLLLLLLVSSGAESQDLGSALVVGREGRKAIRTYDPVAGRTNEIYEAQLYLSDLLPSPSADFVAFLEWNVSAGQSMAHLAIIDTEGNVIYRNPPPVADIAWCCEHDVIAFIHGLEDEHGFRQGRRQLILLNVRSGQEEQIDIGAIPREIGWARFDSSLYLRTGDRRSESILKYDVSSGAVSVTSHHGIEFSPDGNYYLNIGEAHFEVFASAGDRGVTDELPGIMKRTEVPKWVPYLEHSILLVTREFPDGTPPPSWRTGAANAPTIRWHMHIVDVSTGRIQARQTVVTRDGYLKAPSHRWISSGHQLPVERDGRVELLRTLDR